CRSAWEMFRTDQLNTRRSSPRVLHCLPSHSASTTSASGLRNDTRKNMSSLRVNRWIDTGFKYVGVTCTFLGIVVLLIFLGDILIQGLTRIDWDFLTNLPSRRPHRAGILTAWTGTAWLLGLTAVIAIPLGIAAGIFLQEYGTRNRLARIIELNIANLAGVPSVIYGLLGLQIFVRSLRMGGSLLAGACTLALLVLPVIIVSTREALKAVPSSLREASYGMGA